MKPRKNRAAVALGKLRAQKGPDLAETGRQGGLRRAERLRASGKPAFVEGAQVLGGLAGGAARAAALSPEERKAIAAKAARAMWAKKRQAQGLPPKPGDEEFLGGEGKR
jgi:hypothetical protein